MTRPLPMAAVFAAAALLSACTQPGPAAPGTPSDPKAPAATASASPSGSPKPAGRQGWRITGTNVLGDWQPTDACGGDYVFVMGFGLDLLETLTDLEGNQSNDGPHLSVAEYGDEGWGYLWTDSPDGPAGSFVDGGKSFDWAPGPDGHPPAILTVSGGWYRTVNSAGSWDTHRGADTLTLRFERIPEPEWCLEDEQYGHEEGGRWEWNYYD